MSLGREIRSGGILRVMAGNGISSECRWRCWIRNASIMPGCT
jgi:hypothetical protein